MDLNFETRLYGDGHLANFEDPSAPLIDLGALTEEDLGCIMDIAARKGYWVLTKPVPVVQEVQTYG